MGIFRGDAGVLEDASLVRSEVPLLVEPCHKEAPFKEFCGDIVMGSDASIIGLIYSVCTKPLDLTLTSSLYFTPLRTCIQFMSP